jgi:hypothetical protein
MDAFRRELFTPARQLSIRQLPGDKISDLSRQQLQIHQGSGGLEPVFFFCRQPFRKL